MVPPERGTVVVRQRTFSQEDIDRFAALSGDDNPIHVDVAYSAATRFGRTAVHGMLLCSVIAGVAYDAFPGAVLEEQSLVFPAPTFAGEGMTIRLVVLSAEDTTVTVAVEITDPSGTPTCTGEMALRWVSG